MIIENKHTVLTTDGKELIAISYAFVLGTVFMRDTKNLLIKIMFFNKQNSLTRNYVGKEGTELLITVEGFKLAECCAKSLSRLKEIHVVINKKGILQEITFGEDRGLHSAYNSLYCGIGFPVMDRPDRMEWIRSIKAKTLEMEYDPKSDKFGFADVSNDVPSALKILEERK